MEPTRKQLADFARIVADTAPVELDCGAVLDRLAPFLEAARRRGELPAELETVRQHLRVCPECLEEFEALEALYDAGTLDD